MRIKLLFTLLAASLVVFNALITSNATSVIQPIYQQNDRIGTAVAQTLTQQAVFRISITPTQTPTLTTTPTTFELSEQDVQTAAAATIAALISATPSPTATSQFWQTETAVARTIGGFNELFGDDGWFCIPNARNSIGVKQLPSNYVVPSEMIQIDARDRQYFPKDRIVEELPATIYFNFIVNVEDCPSWQQEALLQWKQAQRSPIELTRQWFDTQFGRGNWYCTLGLSTNVSIVRLKNDFTVQYPFVSADDIESYYGVGEIIPAGNSIGVWTFNISRSECP